MESRPFFEFCLMCGSRAARDVLAATIYTLEVRFNEIDFSYCDFDARTDEFGQRTATLA